MKSCFFISRIGDVGSPEREFSDKLLKYIIEPVLTRTGYGKPTRADQITQPGIIVSQVFKQLLESDLVIADLTGQNPNVFYELAVRHIVKRPFVQMIRKGEKLPFDIAANRTIYFDFDVAEAGAAIESLEQMIKSAEDNPECSATVLSFAMEMLPLGKSDKSSERSIADALFMLQGIQGIVAENLEITRSDSAKRTKVDKLDAFLPLFDDLQPLLPYFMEVIRNARRSIESAAPPPHSETIKPIADRQKEPPGDHSDAGHS